MTLIEKILSENGPMLSGELAKLLSEKSGINNNAVKQQLSRSKDPIKHIGGAFLYNQSLFYLEEHVKNGRYIETLKELLKSSSKRIYTVIKALEYHKGYMKESEVSAYMFSPVKNLKGHKRSDIVLRDAARFNLIKTDPEYVRLNEVYFSKSQISFRHFKAIEIARNFILHQFMDWARMIGMVSFETATLYSEFSKFQWAFVSPSYITSLTYYKDNTIIPAFVLGDILIGKQVKEDDIIFYIEKIKVLKAIKSATKFIPFLIVDNITSNAFSILKKQGIIVGFVEKLFGKGYSDLLKTLINTIANAGVILKKNPENFITLMNKISVLVDGKTNNLRGDLFEMAVGYYHSRLCNSLDVSKIIYIDGNQKELDVFAVYTDFVKICECKGTKSPINSIEVNKWLEKVNILRGWLQEQEAYNNKRQVFELWSTGGFTEDAKLKLEKAGNAEKFDLLFFGEAEILKKAREIKGSKKFVDILNQYFLKEPV